VVSVAQERKAKMDLFVKGILLSVAYSASIGGTSTLVGTAPNLVLVNQFAAIFPLAPAISFFKWYAPPSLSCVLSGVMSCAHDTTARESLWASYVCVFS
jgi:di/tricarboxylate transporter